jgi:subtilisin family serine protease
MSHTSFTNLFSRFGRRKTVAFLAVGVLVVTAVAGAVVVSANAEPAGEKIAVFDPRSVGPTSPTMSPAEDTVVEVFEGTQDVIVETTSGGTAALVAVLNRLGIPVNHTFGTALDGAAVSVTQEQLEAIRAESPDATVSADQESVLFDSRTQDSAPWNVDRIDQTDFTPANTARTFNYPTSAGGGATVFVVDSGFTRTNDELDGRVGAGKDFAGGDHGTPNNTSDDSSVVDCNGHGTHVAGTVGSITYGVAKQATVVPVRVFDCTGSTSTSTVIAGVDWAVANRPATGGTVISMSLGTTGGSTALDRAVQNAINAGVTVVVASGNGGADGIGDDACTGSTNSEGNYENGTSPARVAGAITVGATGFANGSAAPVGARQDIETYFSNYGTCVDVFAPGWNVLSLSHTSASPVTMSGTSMATPLVAGAAALFLSANPTASPAAVNAALTGNAAVDKITYAEDFWPAYINGFPTERATHTPNLLVNTMFITPRSDLANAPARFTSPAATVDTVALSWEAPQVLNGNAITGYSIQHRDSTGSAWVTSPAPTSKSTTGSVTGLVPGTVYDFRVAAVTSKGVGTFAEPIAVSTLTGITTAPRNLTVGESTLTSVTLTWAAPAALNGGTITDYLIQYRVGAATPWQAHTRTPSTDTTATITGVAGTAGTQYRLSAVTAQGTSVFTEPVTRPQAGVPSIDAPAVPQVRAPSVDVPSVPQVRAPSANVPNTPNTPTVTVPDAVLSAPSDLKAVAATASSVALTWSESTTTNGSKVVDYVVQYRVIGAKTWETFGHTPKPSTGQTVTGLRASTRYEFQVNATSAAGSSSASATVETSTTANINIPNVPRFVPWW